MRRIAFFSAVTALCSLTWSLTGANEGAPPGAELEWPVATREQRPWTYWWWMGSAVDKPALSALLETYREAGLGGVHIIPIYGVKGREERYIEYLSPRWMEVLEHTIREATRIDLGVDMSTGTGWPFGGPQVTPADAASKVTLKQYELSAGARLEDRLPPDRLQVLMGYSDDGQSVDLTRRVDEEGTLDWSPAAGTWRLHAVLQEKTGQNVKRAAPGGQGKVIDPFSRTALMHYLARFDAALEGHRGAAPRAQYHDSFEYYGANWTENLFDEFLARRGYDLRQWLPALSGRGSDDTVARVKSDYRETMSDLLLEAFIEPWVKWSHEHGCRTRNQAHGSPGNLLDLYAAADIPETEIFGPSGFKIPGLRTDPDFRNAPPDPLMLKFASSAAHVAGRRLVSSETCTWLGEHFKVALSQAKPEIDQLFTSGINHVFYHGMAYSPPDEAWPGWLFYASTNFAPSNSFWRDLPALNAYITRVQSVLQSGSPANDILVYFPMHDLWYEREGLLSLFSVHAIDDWLHGSSFYTVARVLQDRGYTFDYVSDRLLASADGSSEGVRTAGGDYRVVVVPDCRFMPLPTLRTLLRLAREGATIIVHGELPRDVPGFGALEDRRRRFRELVEPLEKADEETSPIHRVDVGSGRILIGRKLEELLRLGGVSREAVADHGINFVRRRHPGGHHYFLVNLGSRTVDGWVRFGTRLESAVILDPLATDRSGVAAVRREQEGESQVYLQLAPGQSLIVRTFSSRRIEGPKWRYLRRAAAIDGETASVGAPDDVFKGKWTVEFLEGGPTVPQGFETRALTSWTEAGGPDARVFAGAARYTTRFEKPARDASEWILDLGRVCESARVEINGRRVGTLWSHPFRVRVGDFLTEGQNVLRVEVTNLAANRIADLDRRGIPWKKFHDANFVNIRYRPFDASQWPPVESGLLGPVRLVPADRVTPR